MASSDRRRGRLACNFEQIVWHPLDANLVGVPERLSGRRRFSRSFRPHLVRWSGDACQRQTSPENGFGTSNGSSGRPSKALRHVLPTTRWKVGRRRLARGRTADALHGWCAQRQLIDLLPLDSRFSGPAWQSRQQHSLHRVAPIVVKHGHPVALRLFVSTRSLAASFVRPWTVRILRVSVPFVRRTLSTDGQPTCPGRG